MSRDEARLLLNVVADLFAASPRRSFTRDEIVQALRDLPDEIEHQADMLALELHATEGLPS
jgi:hypothetical protein